MAKTIQQVLEMADGIELVDIRFVDLPGTWQHFTMPAHRLTPDFFEDGIPFDGSSIRGFQEIHESDMLLKADPDSAFIDPTAEISTLVLSCNVFDPLTFEAYSRDPRYVALKAENYKFTLTLTAEGFEVSAVPVEYGKTGKLSLFIDQVGILRGGDHGGAAATASDEPIGGY